MLNKTSNKSDFSNLEFFDGGEINDREIKLYFYELRK